MSLKNVVMDIPHGGNELPPEVEPHLHPEITRRDLVRESDLYSRGFFLNQPEVPAGNKIFFEQFRVIVDANREFDDFSPDGIVKTRTAQGKTLYREGHAGLPEQLKSHLVDRYAAPHRGRLREAVAKPGTRLVVLCHTMDSVGPPAGVGPGRKRPLLNIANGGDKMGNPDPGKPYQAPREIMEFIRDEIESKVASLNLRDVVWNGKPVGINSPFCARKSIDRIGAESLRGRSAFMVEVNKSIVMDTVTLEEKRLENIAAVRKIIHDVLESVLGRLTR